MVMIAAFVMPNFSTDFSDWLKITYMYNCSVLANSCNCQLQKLNLQLFSLESKSRGFLYRIE